MYTLVEYLYMYSISYNIKYKIYHTIIMANRMTNLELSESIKNYIKELFDNDIKFVLEKNYKIN